MISPPPSAEPGEHATRQDPSNSPEPLLELIGITKTYEHADSAVLHDINLRVYAGDMVAIIGPSGSGKSTLLNVLGLLDTPTAGTYRLKGRDMTQVSTRDLDILRSRHLGFVFQDAHLLPHESVIRNVALPLRVQGVQEQQQMLISEETLTQLGLQHRLAHSGSALSGGERQRVAIARALSTHPDILLADEPTGNLDRVTTERVMQDFKRLNAAGTTIILITHDEEVARQASRCLRMVDGRLEEVHGSSAQPEEQSHAVGAPPVVLERSPVRAWFSSAWDAAAALTTRLGRSALLCAAYALAVTGLVASSGLLTSTAHQVSERLETAALDEVRLSPVFKDFSSAQAGEVSGRLTGITGVTAVGYRTSISGDVTKLPLDVPAPYDKTSVRTYAADTGYLEAAEATLTPANARTLFTRANTQKERPSALVGQHAAKQLGISGPGAGSIVTVKDQEYSVVGIIEDSPRDALLLDSVVIDLNSAASYTQNEHLFLMRTKPGYPAPVSEVASLTVDAAYPQNYQVQTVTDLRSLHRGVSQDIATLSLISSWGILLLAALSAGTTLYLSVQTRRGEIALRRAVGASKAAVRRMFLLEGLFIGLAGGILGMTLGTFLTLIVCQINGWKPILEATPLFLGLAAGGLSGLVSALIPAIVASKAQPADAIRTT